MTYIYMAKYKVDGKVVKKRIETFRKDIEEAYKIMVNNFGHKGFIELYFSYKKEA